MNVFVCRNKARLCGQLLLQHERACPELPQKEPAYGCANLLAWFVSAFDCGARRSFVDLQSDGLFFLPLGGARLRQPYRGESVLRSTPVARMGHMHSHGVHIVGAIGLILSALVLSTLVWVLADYGILNPDRPSLLSWILLIIIGSILGIGLSWSLLRTRVTGQVEVD
jgi:Family of unknown function (DUF6524)